MPTPIPPGKPQFPPPPPQPQPATAWPTDAQRDALDWPLKELTVVSHNELIAWETAISLAKQLWSPDTYEANLQAEKDAVAERLKK
jgi:hypothetical protein